MREDNIEIFKDTERLCKTNAALASAIKESSAAQKIILEGDTIEVFVRPKSAGATQSVASPKNAAAYKNVLADYRRAFKVIEFAVYCSPRDEENYLVVRRALG